MSNPKPARYTILDHSKPRVDLLKKLGFKELDSVEIDRTKSIYLVVDTHKNEWFEAEDTEVKFTVLTVATLPGDRSVKNHSKLKLSL